MWQDWSVVTCVATRSRWRAPSSIWRSSPGQREGSSTRKQVNQRERKGKCWVLLNLFDVAVVQDVGEILREEHDLVDAMKKGNSSEEER